MGNSDIDDTIVNLINRLFHILDNSVRHLQRDLHINDVTVNHGTPMQDALKVLRGAYVAPNAIQDVRKIKTCIMVNIYLSSIGTTVRLETYWPHADDKKGRNMGNNEHITKLTKIIEELYHMLTIMHKWCGKRKEHLYIILFLFNSQKKYPKDDIKKGKSIDPEHVNSGFSYLRSDIGVELENMVDIVVYRKEEVLKVMKHEIIHVMGMHPTNYPREYDDHLKDRYNIQSLQSHGSLNIFEGYVEFLSLFLNTFIYTYNATEGRRERESEFKRVFEKAMQTERTNCLRLMHQISHDLGIATVRENTSTSRWMFEKILKENTNVFSYYFIKTALLDDWKGTMVKLGRISPKYAVDDDTKTHKYFELVREKLMNLTPPKKSYLLRRSITNMKMSFHDRL